MYCPWDTPASVRLTLYCRLFAAATFGEVDVGAIVGVGVGSVVVVAGDAVGVVVGDVEVDELAVGDVGVGVNADGVVVAVGDADGVDVSEGEDSWLFWVMI